MGISPLSGAIAASGGTLELDSPKPSTAKVSVTFKVADMSTTVPAFTQHLLSADFFEAEKHPNASFTPTSLEASGQKAKITGNLTIKGSPSRLLLRPNSLEPV
jgi:polyisoprenoid-binding protein YceI